MSMRCDKYSLRKLLEKVAKEFPGVREAYIFGSRRHRTRSTRSDLDILILADGNTSSEELRDFALRECHALDFFLLDGSVATSCSNGSKVRGTSKRNLIERLDALPLWTAKKGFTDSDVDWDFEVIKGMNPIMTTLITSEPFPSKEKAISSIQGVSETSVTNSSWSSITRHPIVILATAVMGAAAATYAVINSTRIIPLQERIQTLEKNLAEAESRSDFPKAKKGLDTHSLTPVPSESPDNTKFNPPADQRPQ
jgi:predicted nucleotidyltransferase